MNVFAKFDKILSMILKDIKETKRYVETVGRSDVRTDKVKTVYPPTNIARVGYNHVLSFALRPCWLLAVPFLYSFWV